MCIDASGNLLQTCQRDGDKEDYLEPHDHPVGVEISGDVPAGQTCAWSFDDGQGPLRQTDAPCEQEVKLRVAYGRTTVATVDIPLGDGTAQRIVTEIAVRDMLIAGMGDSIAAGEGNPDKAVQLEGGFCFMRFLRGSGVGQFYRPGRAGYGSATAHVKPAWQIRRPSPIGRVTALAGWIRHATAHCTAISFAPRWRLRSSSRILP